MPKRFKFMILMLGVIICLIFVLVIKKREIFDKQQEILRNGYEYKFYDAANYLDDIKNLLKKVEIAKISGREIIFFANIWHKAKLAHEDLVDLKLDYDLNKVLKYLLQTSDFSYVMLEKAIEKKLSEDDWKKVRDLKIYGEKLSDEFNKLLVKNCVGERIYWDRLIFDKNKERERVYEINDIKKAFQEYGELIYDGAFSDHVINIKPKFLMDKKEIKKQEGIKILKKMFESKGLNKIKKILSVREVKGKNFDFYLFDVIDDKNEEISIEISKRGGYLLLMLNGGKKLKREDFSDKEKMEIKEGIELAKDFLRENNFFDMKENYYEETENSLIINFAREKDKVVYYSDLVKVKVDLYKKKIIGVEALGYLNMNCNREKDFLSLDLDLVENLLPDGFDKIKIKECVILNENREEVFCYEIMGKYTGERFLVYINEKDGKLEKIYKMIENGHGVIVE